MTDAPALAVTLEFLAEQQAKMLAEIADQRANIETLLTIVQRLDATIGSLLDEVHALQARASTMAICRSMHSTRRRASHRRAQGRWSVTALSDG